MKTALLVIDAQKIYSNTDSGYYVDEVQKVVDNINSIIKKFKEDGNKIIYIKHMHEADGSDSGRMFDFSGEMGEIEFKSGTDYVEFIDGLIVTNDTDIIIKKRYDSFIGTPLKQILDENSIQKIVITGFMTNFCCESTARSAHDLDFYVDFVSDATGTPGTEQFSASETKKATLATLEEGFANIIETSEIIK